MFVDNVVTILTMAPVALPLARALKLPVVPVILMIGFGANFMGTALIIGDLPPQMLHSVAGAEFFDFIWHKGRPSSFPILMVTFLITLGAMGYYGFRGYKRVTDLASLGVQARIENPLFATVVVVWFLGTVVAMSMREHIGVQLGFIALTGAISLVLVLALLGNRVKASSFEECLQGLDWRAIFSISRFLRWWTGSRKATSSTSLPPLCGRSSSTTTRSGRPCFTGSPCLSSASSSTMPTSSPSSTPSRTWLPAASSRGRCGGCCCGPGRCAATSPSQARRPSMSS